jgi:hypothetical protein
MNIERESYLKKLIDSMHIDLIKVVTGIRRCGKSYLLFQIFYDYLKKNGVDETHIIKPELFMTVLIPVLPSAVLILNDQ